LHHISSKWEYSNTSFHLEDSMSLLNNKSPCSKKKVQDVTWKVPLYMLSIWLSCRFSTWRCFREWNEFSGMERILLLLRSKCCILVSGCRASTGMLVTEEAKPWDNLSITNDCPICEIKNQANVYKLDFWFCDNKCILKNFETTVGQWSASVFPNRCIGMFISPSIMLSLHCHFLLLGSGTLWTRYEFKICHYLHHSKICRWSFKAPVHFASNSAS